MEIFMKEARIIIDSTVEELDDAGLTESSDKTHAEAVGTVKKSGGAVTVSYSQTTEGVTSHSVIEVGADAVTVKRSGDAEYAFVFKEGELTSSLYTVPPYSFDTDIYTRRIRNSLTENGTDLTLIYDMTIGGAKKKTTMKIRVIEK